MKVTIALIIVLFAAGLGYAQSICPIEILEVDGIAGRINWNDKTELPLAGVRVKLLDSRLNDSDSPLASLVTAEDGRFAFNDLKKGKYILAVTLYVDEKPYFEYRVGLAVRKSKTNPVRSLIQLKLGTDCWKSEIRVDKNLHR